MFCPAPALTLPHPPTHPPQMFIIWHFGEVFGCVMLLVLIKFVIVAMVMKSFGFTWEASTLAGACMAQVAKKKTHAKPCVKPV